MTTHNHTTISLVTAALTESFPLEGKILVIIGLMITHLPFDLVPHWESYTFDEIMNSKKDMVLFIFGMILGFLILPAIGVYFLGLNFWWMVACILAANLLDILVALNIGWAGRLNNYFHYGNRKIGEKSPALKKWELGQTLILLSGLALAIILLRA